MRKYQKWVFIAAFVSLLVIIGKHKEDKKDDSGEKVETEVAQPSKGWSNMTYEERASFLNGLIENKTLESQDEELKHKLWAFLASKVANPSTVEFTLQPSIYNGFANVVEADSGWIYVPFKLTAQNDYGVKKEISGSVMFQYLPESNSLIAHHWDMSK